MKNLRALLTRVDFATGERAGSIDPRDPKLPCRGWQDTEKGLEIRLVEDDRDLTMFDGVDGVTVLNGKGAINDAVKKHFVKPSSYTISNETIMIKHMEERNISLDVLSSKNGPMNKILKELYEDGIAGITELDNQLYYLR